MKYVIVPQDNTVMVKIEGDEGVTETLNLLEGPSKTCMLVQQSKKDVLGEINLEKMLTNLDHCVDLLQITFNAVDGFGVQSMVQDLSKKFIDAMNKSNTTALAFKLATSNAMNDYLNAYEYLFYGEIGSAVMLLADTKDIASQMVKKADELVEVYDGLTAYTNTVLMEVMKERADDEKKRTETKALINELEGSIKAMEGLKENLKKDIQHFEEDYIKLRDREMKQEERAYNMQLASMITGVFGRIFGAGSSALNQNDKEERNQSEKQAASETGEVSAEVKAKREYADTISQQEQKKSLIKKADERIADIDKILDGQLYKGGANNASADQTKPDTQKTDEQLRSEKQEKVTEKGKLNEELNTLKGQEETVGNTLKGFGVALDKLSEDTRNATQEIQKTADSLAARMEVIGRRRDELKDQERTNLVNLAVSTAKMKNMVMDENSFESAIQCLVIAIGCLRKVLAYLQEIKLFWMNVETFCSSLATNKSISNLVSMQESKSPEQRAAYFKTILFVKGYVGIVAKWKALNVIFEEYLIALSEVSARMSNTIEQSLSADRRVQWKIATELAGNLNERLKLEISEK